MDFLPYYKIEPGKIVEYYLPEGNFKTDRQVENEKWLHSTKQYLSDLSEKSRKRLLFYLKTLYVLSKENTILAKRVIERSIKDEVKVKLGEKYKRPVKYRLVFITLTLSAKQMHSDIEIKKRLLKDFLDRMVKRWQTYLYVWKAEKQENGNIHFHIVVNRYVPHQWIRQTWNKIQEKLGYISAFERKHGHRNPNSTDVHAVYKVKRLDGYFAKYVSKLLDENLDQEVKDIVKRIRSIDLELVDSVGDNRSKLLGEKEFLLTKLRNEYGDRLIEGRIWDASQTLKQIQAFSDLGYLDSVFPNLDYSRMKRLDFSINEERGVTVWFFEIDNHPELKKFLLDYYSKELLKLKPNTLFKVL